MWSARIIRLLVGAVAILAALAAIGGSASAKSKPKPKVFVSPNTGLIGGNTVTVSGEGFPPGSNVSIGECTKAKKSPKYCSSAGVVSVATTSSGAVPPTAFQVISGRVGSKTECGTEPANTGCYIEVSGGSKKNTAFAPITFALPEVIVAPNTGLENGQEVMVSGKNFQPNSKLFIVQCTPGVQTAKEGQPYCNIHNLVQASPDSSGNVSPKAFKVITGAIGSNGTTCGTSKADEVCFIGVGDAAANGNNSALGKITFKVS
jgi:Neocarzinostatin family